MQFARRHFISIKEVFNRSKIQKINSRTISHGSVPLHSTSNLLYILFFLFSTEQLSLTADSVPSVSLFVY